MSGAAPETITGEVALTVAGETMSVRVTVPRGDTALTDLLPIFHELTNTLVDRAVERDAAPGRSVSCRAGCGACCRQAVPVSPSEARALAQLVDALPEPRRAIVRDRFTAARATLAANGVDCRPEAILSLERLEVRTFGLRYFEHRVACPFLEAEACSIHPDRPTACREYLVTTPAINCSTPTLETVRGVPLPGHVSLAILAVDQAIEGHGSLILVDALDWVDRHPAAAATRPGPAIVQSVFAQLAASS